MKKKYIVIIIIGYILFNISNSYSGPAPQKTIELNQFDGSKFFAKQWGDELYHGIETIDGYTIVFNKTAKSWNYAKNSDTGDLIDSGYIAVKNKPPENIFQHVRPKNLKNYLSKKTVSLSKIQKLTPTSGIAKIPVILINFKDTTSTYSAADFEKLLFGTSNKSLKDYYEEVSYGQFSVSSGSAGVTGWYQASKSHDYYGQNNYYGDMYPEELVLEAVKAADNSINFADYDIDNYCYCNAVLVIYQGEGEDFSGRSTDIWPHQSTINYTTNDKSNCGNIKISKYILISEKIWSGKIRTIGGFAHEYGHVLGLPDLYDTYYTSEGVGLWCLMAYGSWMGAGSGSESNGDTPSHLSAWCKYFLGWIKPTKIIDTLFDKQIAPSSQKADVYQFLSGSEYFLIENRQKIGFDAGLTGSGLAVWHIDENKSNNDNECYPPNDCTYSHYKVSLVQADNRWDLEKNNNNGDSGDLYPGLYGNTSLTDISSPNSKLYNKSSSNVYITSIQKINNNIQATLSNNLITTTTSSTTTITSTSTTISPTTSISDSLNHIHYDFNGDGKTDLLWKNKANGKVAVWLMNGIIISSYDITGAVEDLNWEIINVGDFNGDGKTDCLWKHKTSGKVAVWLMNGSAIQSYDITGEVSDLNWEIINVGDFNGDGKTDLLWKHKTSGKVAVWLMNGSAIQSYDITGEVSDLNWEIINVGDFNGDGKTDCLWKHKTSGKVAVWLMNGSAIQSYDITGEVSDLNWEIINVGDFNGDGKTDCLWKHKTSGKVAVWLMNGSAIQSYDITGEVSDSNWEIIRLGDFNGDGKADLLWKHKISGKVAVWLMNGTVIQSYNIFAAVSDLNWEIIRVGDFNGDGKADLLWKHKISGKVAVWLMNGTVIQSYDITGEVSDLNWEIIK